MSKYRVAVVGASGNVGRAMLDILAERSFPAREVVALASSRSANRELTCGSRRLRCRPLADFDFSECDLAFFAAGSEVALAVAPRAAEQGCIVIDNSSAFRQDPDVPLVVPEVNPEALAGCGAKGRNGGGIVANPNCSTAQMMVVLKPLHDLGCIRRVVLSTYQSVSGAGKRAMDELWAQTKSVLMTGGAEPENFTKQIAFNVIPHVDRFLAGGATREEWKMQAETRRILDPSIRVSATCVRVPVFVGHGESINLEFARKLRVRQARKALKAAAGVSVRDRRADGGYATPVESAGRDATYVSRIRRDRSVEHGLNLWCVSDNLRKGAALNAIQIAERLHADSLLSNA